MSNIEYIQNILNQYGGQLKIKYNRKFIEWWENYPSDFFEAITLLKSQTVRKRPRGMDRRKKRKAEEKGNIVQGNLTLEPWCNNLYWVYKAYFFHDGDIVVVRLRLNN